MKDELFNELVASVREGGKILRGKAKPSRTFVIKTPNVKKIRANYKLSQSEFAALMGISIKTLQNWEQGRRDGFAFWRTRVARQLERFDLVRIDHFRGLAAHWAVPAGAASAREGHWVPTPGSELLAALRAAAGGGSLPLVAEDLGVITPDVDALRHDFDLPGMRVLQFGFDGSNANPHLPHNYTHHTVAYTGTHDNDTTLGWYRSLDPATAARVDDYLGSRPADMPLALVRAVLASVAELAVVPMADVLGLGSEARFNTPGTVGGNWSWRLPPDALTPELAQRHAQLNARYGRAP